MLGQLSCSSKERKMKDPKLLDLYSDYLLASFRMATATGLSELTDQALSHDKISRFFRAGSLHGKGLLALHKAFGT
jgi:hypothetical protein